MKCLFIRKNREDNTGGAVISDRNFRMFEQLFDGEIFDFRLKNKSKFSSLMSFLRGRMDGAGLDAEKEIIRILKDQNFSHVFVDSSLYGTLIKVIKKQQPKIKVISFYHNIEYFYFKQLIRTTNKKRHYITLNAIKKNEKLTTNLSDALIVLNKRDSDLLERYYAKKANFIMPTSMDDKFNETKIRARSNKQKNILFVGSRFFPNEEGVRWFIKNVTPHLENRFIFNVVGKNFEELQAELETANVNIIGSVTDLEGWYYNSDVVVSPIFSGGGMKTKVAEALMYGKTVIGTTEAFEGYDVVNPAMYLCNTADEFIKILRTENLSCFNKISREEFLRKYCDKSVFYKFKQFIRNI